MKSVRTVQTIRTVDSTTYAGNKKSRWKVEDYVKVYAGSHQDCCFVVQDIRYNEDIEQFEYLCRSFGSYFWVSEHMLTDVSNSYQPLRQSGLL